MLNFQWWADIARRAISMAIFPRRKTTQMAVYTDSTAETVIMAANVLGAAAFKKTKRTESRRKIKADPWRVRSFAEEQT